MWITEFITKMIGDIMTGMIDMASSRRDKNIGDSLFAVCLVSLIPTILLVLQLSMKIKNFLHYY